MGTLIWRFGDYIQHKHKEQCLSLPEVYCKIIFFISWEMAPAIINPVDHSTIPSLATMLQRITDKGTGIVQKKQQWIKIRNTKH